jgi:hypothetical protein
MTSKENSSPVEDKALDNVLASNPSTIYLFKEKKANVAYKEFKRLLEEGYEGLCITRSPPNQIRERFDLGNCTILWLTGNKPLGIETLAPNDISRLASLITKFIIPNGNENGNTDAALLKRVVILDNIEYIIMQNNFPTILRVLHLVRDKIMLSSAIMLIPLDPLSIDFKELRLVERESEVIDLKDY